MNDITIWINDLQLNVDPGQTIIAAADQAGIVIPRLCFHPSVKPSGACRLCAVEVAGYRGLAAACSTEVTDGMRVHTDTPRVLDFRREMLRLILKDHPRECLACPRNGTCELQQLVEIVGIDFPYSRPTGPICEPLPGGAYFERDYRLCVHCGRCVRVCHEVRGAKAVILREIKGRQEVATPFDRSLEAAGCQFCGACVDACPVGALREKEAPENLALYAETTAVCENLADILLGLYRKQVQNESKSALCPLCSAGCTLRFEVAGGEKILRTTPDPEGAANRGQACVQGRFLLKSYLQGTARLKKPAVFAGGSRKETSWDAALDLAAARLKGYGPGEVAVITDAHSTDEELNILNQFGAEVLKADAIGSFFPEGYLKCAAILKESLGPDALNGNLETLLQADGIMVFGANPAAENPILGVALRQATLKGKKLLNVNPCETALDRFADISLRLYPGSETALICGFLHLILEQAGADPDLLSANAAPAEQLKTGLATYNMETVAQQTGLSTEILEETAALMDGMQKIAFIFGPGLMASPDCENALKGLAALALLKEGTVLPVGSSRIETAGNLKPFSISAPPKKARAALVVLENLAGRPVQGLAHWLENPEFVLTAAACEPDFKTDILLPLAAVPEKEGTLTNWEGRIQHTAPVIPPPGEAKPLTRILEDLAQRLGHPRLKPADAGLPASDKSRPSFHWEPPPATDLPEADPDFPFALVSKKRLAPYFLGPLLAEETKQPFTENNGIEMNPADAYRIGLRPGEAVVLQSGSARGTGTLAVSRLLPPKMIAVSEEILDAAFEAEKGEPVIFCRVTKPETEAAALEDGTAS